MKQTTKLPKSIGSPIGMNADECKPKGRQVIQDCEREIYVEPYLGKPLVISENGRRLVTGEDCEILGVVQIYTRSLRKTGDKKIEPAS